MTPAISKVRFGEPGMHESGFIHLGNGGNTTATALPSLPKSIRKRPYVSASKALTIAMQLRRLRLSVDLPHLCN